MLSSSSADTNKARKGKHLFALLQQRILQQLVRELLAAGASGSQANPNVSDEIFKGWFPRICAALTICTISA